MPYLRYQDYIKTIQDVQIQQIIAGDDTQRILCEHAAQATAIEHLVVKYDISKEFTETLPFSYTTAYQAQGRVELNFIDYNPTNGAALHDLRINADLAYICTMAQTGAFDVSKWTLLGKKYDLFYVTNPHPEFNYKIFYNKGDKVIWKNKIYTASIGTQLMDHTTQLQYTLDTIPIPNVFPDDLINGVQYWGVGTTYTVTAGTLPTDATKWTKGDNRNASMVRRLVQVCLFYLHDRLSQRNIPQLRADGYAEAMAWLDAANQGEITVDLPLVQPKIDGRIRYGGDVKRINQY